jgi:hypothetical protein
MYVYIYAGDIYIYLYNLLYKSKTYANCFRFISMYYWEYSIIYLH